MEDRKTQVIPDGYEAVRDAEGRATGEVRKIPAVAQAVVVPEGYALVPLVPTPEMIEAGCNNNSTQWNEGTDEDFPAIVANDVYVSMVRAFKRDNRQTPI